MRSFGKLVLLSALFVLAGCGGGGGEGGNANLAGTYAGKFNIANSQPFVSVTVTFTVDAVGKLTGTTVGSPSSGAPGEQGTLTGTVSGTVTNIQADVTFASPTLGTYTAKGSGGVFNPSSKELAFGVNASKGGVVVGQLTLIAQQ